MARATLNNKTRYASKKVATQINSHKSTLDGLEAGTSLRILTLTAGNGAGARTCTGAVVGDKVLGVINLTDNLVVSAAFATSVTVTDQVAQTATDYTSDVCAVLLLTPVNP